MKRKFFLTSFVFIVFVVVTTVLVTSFYFSKEREQLLDQQIEAIASGLLANELKDAELSEMDDIVANMLFDQPRTILLNIYDRYSKLIYQNSNSQNILGKNLPPLKEKIFTYEYDEHKLRLLNFPLPNQKTLQVGLLLDQQMSKVWDMNQRIFLLLVIMIFFVLIMAWMLAQTLVRPIEEITFYIRSLTSNVEKNTIDKHLMHPILQKMMKKKGNEEIQFLLESLNYFRVAVEAKIKLTKATVAQMAHELKTPLTIIRNSLEYFQIKKIKLADEESKIISEAIDETDSLNTTIGSFLEWSRFESLDSDSDIDIHALKLSNIVTEIHQSVNKAFPNHTCSLEVINEIQVLANPEDLKQLIRNLIENAFKYSLDKKISIIIKENYLLLENNSNIIPEKVLQRLGEPFNSGRIDKIKYKGIGLGLAWVFSICKRYHWIFNFHHANGKTSAQITFNI